MIVVNCQNYQLKVIVLYVGHLDKLRPFKNRCTLLNQPSTFRNELCMLVVVCSSGYYFFFAQRTGQGTDPGSSQ